MKYDCLIVGAGPGGIFSAYELTKKAPEMKVAVIELGGALSSRKCPIDGERIKSCINCRLLAKITTEAYSLNFRIFFCTKADSFISLVL